MTPHPVRPVRPAVPEDAEELLRLRVDVLTGQAATDAWRATFLADLQARLGTDPHLLAYVADSGDGGDGTLAACAIGVVYRGYNGPSYPDGRWGGSTPSSPIRATGAGGWRRPSPGPWSARSRNGAAPRSS
ncbi:GNAT family N-acetyltransferase [Kitasatospora fiedleri]|uniref:hypothetical protein n=1 Tax=Kitasatospora fiedleri TaxID=2991545 RepID=UPI00249B7306|nr:hypothetical protein [Kitasatospora fiedleri]